MVRRRPKDGARISRWRPSTLPLKASALIAAGLTPGPEIGAALRRAEAAWIASKFTMSKDELKRRALKPTAGAWKSDRNEAP